MTAVTVQEFHRLSVCSTEVFAYFLSSPTDALHQNKVLCSNDVFFSRQGEAV